MHSATHVYVARTDVARGATSGHKEAVTVDERDDSHHIVLWGTWDELEDFARRVLDVVNAERRKPAADAPTLGDAA